MLQTVRQWIEQMITFLQDLPGGASTGLIAPFLESLFPFLPLVLIISANAATYGFWMGVLVSWVGSMLGSLVVFACIRYLFRRPVTRWLEQHKAAQQWIERVRHMSPISLGFFFSLPFMPAFIITAISAMIQLSLRTYLIAAGAGRLIVVIIFSLIGKEWSTFLERPIRLVFLFLILLAIWGVSRGVEEIIKRRALARRSKSLRDLEQEIGDNNK
ncbi:VTT domain-containing protein [Exiguobacterium sp. Helios]|uniref:TVP38/TMEM64 family protein n=1 Tax=unclassified Exiguobacterium TaxID=2644629 RepID=UPI000DF78391|nr:MULTISPECIES: VTT domain-containing protein [unclassified Exiguobacterium]QNR19497.1 VTT domain-containing protein [Exiguobacterium sp. Helios]RDB32887.1 DedA family protein [Exiguobacterium sp. RIT594]